MKRLLILTASCILFFALIIAMPLTVSAADVNTDMNIRVFIDGDEIEFDVKPAVVNQRTMVPMRFIFEYFGADVEWHQDSRKIVATLGDMKIIMWLDRSSMYVNGEAYKLDAAPIVIDQRTLVPLRVIAELFDSTVTWEQETQSVIITTPYPKNLYQPVKEFDPYSYTLINYQDECVTLSFNGSVAKISGIMPEDYKQIAIGIYGYRTLYFDCSVNKNEYFSAELDMSEILYPDTAHIIPELVSERNNSNIAYVSTLNGFDVNIRNNGNIREFVPCTYTINEYPIDSVTVSFDGTVMKVSGISSKDYWIFKLDILGKSCQIHDIKQNEPFSGEFDLTDVLNRTNFVVYFMKTEGDLYADSSIFSVDVATNNGKLYIPKSLVWDHNFEFMSEWINPTVFLDEIENQEFIELSNQICENAVDDYNKLLCIYEWVCSNIYYDWDALYNGLEDVQWSAIDVLHSKRTVCGGYARLISALIQAQGIPCRVILGVVNGGTWNTEYAAETQWTHAWNQAYVGNRWINLDATWGSGNKYENGQFYAYNLHYDYFDATYEYMSLTHKMIEIGSS